ncbi:MAG TPA: 3-hydroxyacyl-CoA dehydrogenase family protein [Chitinophagaceae bacterium]|nr:3-hydroxyacyl-CoA dehydrogenase family protein [Chitinophagaceae bacterium]
MQIIVWADEVIKKELQDKKLNANIQVTFAESFADISDYTSADAFFILKEDINKEEINDFGGRSVFINSVIHTLKELELPKNFSRINGWPTFLTREVWEMATGEEQAIKYIFEKLGWKYIIVADEPGLVSAKIISMIINEAYFALGEEVSTKEEIDLAMKLGTNYPYGPFEWSQKIGLKKVYSVLEKLSKTDSRYNIAPAMKNELTNN